MTDDAAPFATAFPVILAGPSGAGKTTIRDALLAGGSGERFLFSVSMTTREARDGETDGVDYRFVDRAEFEAIVARGDMLEHAIVHGDLYGTPRANLEEAREKEIHLLLDIDVQGTRQVRSSVGDAVSIFVLPPSAERVIERLRRRGSETQAQLERRLRSARAELGALEEFDYVVVNEDRDAAISRVRSIVAAEEVARPRLGDRAAALVERLASELDRI